jgi:hypothetical protein
MEGGDYSMEMKDIRDMQKIKVFDGRGAVTVEPHWWHNCDNGARLAIDLGYGDYLAVYLTPREARRIALALLQVVDEPEERAAESTSVATDW